MKRIKELIEKEVINLKFHNFGKIRMQILVFIIFGAMLACSNAAQAQNDSLCLIENHEIGSDSTVPMLTKIWNLKIFSIKGQAVQISQAVIALFLLIAGLFISRLLTHRLGLYLRKYTQTDQNTAVFLERILLYVLIIVIVLSTLQMIQIPVTMFAFVGGAIAIGVGFGTQNIFNNFISGLVLMIERPVRIGDLIEVDTHLGRVDRVGARCTRIRRVDGVEILVPNSKLLESNVINRTLTDKNYRTTISVGVAYGSPTDQVAEILRHIVNNQPDVLPHPKPEVIFQDFGDNALIFKVFFWVDVDSVMEVRRIESEIRFSIDKQFRENSITIAFPQRDTHLDTLRPLDVRIINSDKK